MGEDLWRSLGPGLTGLLREHVGLGLCLLDHDRVVVATNRGFPALLGRDSSTVGTRFVDLVQPERRGAIPDYAEIPVLDARPVGRHGPPLAPLTRSLSFVGMPADRLIPCSFSMIRDTEVVLVEPDAADRHAVDTIARMNRELDQVRHKLGHATDELARLDAELCARANTDPLTGLVSRSALMARGREQHELTSRGDLALSALLIDLENFKRINVEHGIEVGDRVLVETAVALRESTREFDLVGRWGGGEFLVLLPATDLSAARAVIERFEQRITDLEIEPLSERLAIRVGVAERQTGEPFEGLVQRAGLALLEAKRGGRPTVVIAPDEGR